MMDGVFVRYALPSGSGVGVIEDKTIKALAHDSMNDCIVDGFSTSNVKYSIPLQGTRLLHPVVPSKIICLGLNYPGHVKEMGSMKTIKPMIFFKPPSALIGHEAQVILPHDSLSREVNNEVEFAVVIGDTARNVKADDALEHVAGYTIMQDITARDVQAAAKKRGEQWEVAKAFDTFAPLGPWIVPRAMIDDPHSLRISLRVNGELRQDSNTSRMIYKLPEVIEYLSSVMTLFPGDVISTGTPSGVGLIGKGDVLEAEIEGIGILRNTVN